MSEILVGDVVARLKADIAQFNQAMNDVVQRLGRLNQATQQVMAQGHDQQLQAQRVAAQAQQQAQAQAHATSLQATRLAAAAQRQVTAQTHSATLQAARAATQAHLQVAAQGHAEHLQATRLAAQAQLQALRLAHQQQLQEARIAAQERARAERGSGSGLQTAVAVAGGIGLATSIGAIVSQLRAFVVESVRLSGQMQDLHIAFRAIEGSSGAANTTLARLFETSQRLGVEFTTVTDGFKRMEQAAKGTGLQGETIRQVFEGILQGSRQLGLSSQNVSRALVAVEQIITKNRASAEELNQQFGDAVPGGLGMLARVLGVTTSAFQEMIQLGLVPAESAVIGIGKAMTDVGQDAIAPLERITSVFVQLKNETTAWMTAFGDSINSVLAPFLRDLIQISEELRRIFGIRPPGTQSPPGASTGLGLGPLMPRTLGTMPANPYMPSEFETPAAGRAFASSQFDALIRREAARIAFDPALLSQLIRQESRFNPQAVGPQRPGGSARGLGQIMPATGAEFGLITPADFFDPEKNLTAAANVLQQYRKIIQEKFGTLADETEILLAAYNAGIGNVIKAVEETQRVGEQVTAAQVIGRLPQPSETGPYVRAIMGTPVQVAAPAAAGPALDPFAPMLKTATETTDVLSKIQGRMDLLAQSGLNFGGILDEALTKQADEAVKKFTQMAQTLAAFPELLQQMTPVQKEQLQVAAQQVAAIQARRDLEQSTGAEARQRVQVLRQFEEQLAREQKQAQAELPTMEALLGRAGTLARRPDENVAEEARTRAQQQYIQMQADLEKALEALGDSPALQKLGPTLATQFKDILSQIPQAMEAEGEQAFARVLERQILEPLRALAGESDEAIRSARQLEEAARLAAQAAGTAYEAEAKRLFDIVQDLGLVDKELQERRREFARSGDLLGLELTPDQERSRTFETQMEQTLERLRTPRAERESTRLRQRAAREGIEITPEYEAQLQALNTQERWNTIIAETERLGDQAAQTITTGLLSIVDGTVAVSDGFKGMAKSILQSIAEVTLNEGFRSLIRLGLGVAFGAIGGAAGGAIGGGAATNTTLNSPSYMSLLMGNAPRGAEGLGPINRPTLALIGEGANNPEYVLNRQQMDHLITAAMRDGAHSSRPVALQHGGIVNRPTMAMLGENPAHNPETVLNRQQMQSLMASGPSAGGQAVNVTTILVDSRTKADQVAAQERSLGRQVIIQEVVNELSQGAGSKIGQVLRSTLR